ncbi:hypothetical protein ACIQM4_18975 [Streptomyces sp. NPDC091272]|uniref:hypothetical protein n=1 Tax=Streptomyces sp. NPDC091272 TaxID=3365981 RepID=UPI003802E57D
MTSRPVRPRKQQLLVTLLFLAFALWITGICVSIAHEPPEGSRSAHALRDDVAASVREQDADRLQNLFLKDSVADEYAQDLLDRLRAAGPGNAPVTLESFHGGQFLRIKGTAPAGPVCVAWQITQQDDAWYVDGIPPVTGTGPLCAG